jgi:hypothetical protein
MQARESPRLLLGILVAAERTGLTAKKGPPVASQNLIRAREVDARFARDLVDVSVANC